MSWSGIFILATILLLIAYPSHAQPSDPTPNSVVQPADAPSIDSTNNNPTPQPQPSQTQPDIPPAQIASDIGSAIEAAITPPPPPALPPLRTPVPQIYAAEFEELVHGPRPILVDFFAPWCHFCKQMAPLYEDAAKAMRNQPEAKQAQLVMLDCTGEKERDLCMRFGIMGFPTLRLIRRADPTDLSQPLQMYEFNQPRTTLSFVVFCTQMYQNQPWTSYPELTPEARAAMKVIEDQQRVDAQAKLLQQQQAHPHLQQRVGTDEPNVVLHHNLPSILGGGIVGGGGGSQLGADDMLRGRLGIANPAKIDPATIPYDTDFIRIPVSWVWSGLLIVSFILVVFGLKYAFSHWREIKQRIRKQNVLPTSSGKFM